MNSHLPEKLFVISGLPRSGKTMISGIVGSHSQIAIPESGFNFFQWFSTEKYRSRGGFSENLDFFLDECRKNETFNLSSESFLRSEGDRRDLYCSLLEGFRKENFPQKKYFGEYSHVMEENYHLLVDWFGHERLRFLQIVRDPIDNFASYIVSRNIRLKERGNKNSCNAFVYKFCEMWGKSVTLSLYNAVNYPESFKVVFFETIKKNPVREVESLCKWMGVPPESENMLNMIDCKFSKSNSAFGEHKGPGVGFVRKDYHQREKILSDFEIEAIQSISCSKVVHLTGYGKKKIVVNWKTYEEKDPGETFNDAKHMIQANLAFLPFTQIVSMTMKLVCMLLRNLFQAGTAKMFRWTGEFSSPQSIHSASEKE